VMGLVSAVGGARATKAWRTDGCTLRRNPPVGDVCGGRGGYPRTPEARKEEG
jgi:hypothetical protein